MRFNDTLSGLLLLIAGIAVVVFAWTFPPAPGQSIGPGVFPILTGVGLALCGVVLMWSGVKRREGARLEWEEWVRRPRMALNGALVVSGLIFYALVVDTVGFFLTAFVFLVVLFLAFGVSRRWIVPIAVAVTFGLYGAFNTLLSVPLPGGWLEGLAW